MTRAQDTLERLREIQAQAPWLLPAAVAQAMVIAPTVPWHYFEEFLEPPMQRVTDASLKALAKLAALGGVTIYELKAFIFKRFNALTFPALNEHHVLDLLNTYKEYGATYGPTLFARDLRAYLAGHDPDGAVV
jgi:hypothetical protein